MRPRERFVAALERRLVSEFVLDVWREEGNYAES
jgi:hypothetical protein